MEPDGTVLDRDTAPEAPSWSDNRTLYGPREAWDGVQFAQITPAAEAVEHG